MSKNLTALSGRKGLSNNLFERLGNLSDAEGTPGGERLLALAEEFLMGPANLYGTTTFYDFLRPENRHKKIYLCSGSSCRLAGTQEALANRLQQLIPPEEIGEMCCLGRCYENGAVQCRGRNYSALTPEAVGGLLEGASPGEEDPYSVAHYGTAVLTAAGISTESRQQAIRTMLSRGSDALVAEITTSGLRGRGGAGFPLAGKVATCRDAGNGQKFVVCNADEGDPGSYSDRYLLEQHPESVLLGMLMAGFAVGARTGVLYVRAEYPEAVAALECAIEQWREQNLAGPAVLGSDFSFDFKIIRARGAYICGEETALLASIEGQRPEVRIRPPFPAQEGLFGKPTLVNNVETLANLPYVLMQGGAAFAAIGTAKSRGTKLLSLDSAFRRPGVYEVDMGTPLAVVVDELGGGFRRPVKALHIGGPLGGLVPVSRIPELTVDFESFAAQGFLLGHASVVGIPADYPLIEYLEHLFDFTAHESCGKCFPCRLGSVRGRELLHRARTGDDPLDPELFDDLLTTLEKGSLCGLGGGMPLPVRNALTYFEEELAPFFAKKNEPKISRP